MFNMFSKKYDLSLMAENIIVAIFIIRCLHKAKKLTEKEFKDAGEYLKCMDTLFHVMRSPNAMIREDGEPVKDSKEMAFTLFKAHRNALKKIMEKYIDDLDDIDQTITISCDHMDICIEADKEDE